MMQFRVTTSGPIPLSACATFFNGLSTLHRGYAVALDPRYYGEFRDATYYQYRYARYSGDPFDYLYRLGAESLRGNILEGYPYSPNWIGLPRWEMPPLSNEPILESLRVGSLEGKIADLIKIVLKPLRRVLSRANEQLDGERMDIGSSSGIQPFRLAAHATEILREEIRPGESNIEIGAGLSVVGATTLAAGLAGLRAVRIDAEFTENEGELRF